MRRKSLTTAVLAGIAGVSGIVGMSSAVNINPDGLGEVLIYPFYTVNGGNDTLVSIVNTTDEVKAVKVRFLESKNSKEVLDFNLYLSGFDVWTGAVTSNGPTGPGLLTTNDNSCTVPILADQADATLANGAPAVSFRTGLLGERFGNGALIDASAERTREGHIEVIEMGEVSDVSSSFFPATSATHVNGVPISCGNLVAYFTNGVFPWASGNLDAAMSEPMGGLFGGASVVNVAGGYLASYNADAIEGFFDTGIAGISLHSFPGDTKPDLRDVTTGVVGGDITSNVFFNASVVTSTWTRNPLGVGLGGIDAISALFMRDAIFNEYALDPELDAATEWVVTFPTKRYYVDLVGPTGPFAVRPFTNPFRDNGSACEPIGLQFWDREEGSPGGEVDFSPSFELVPSLCFETQVISFGQGEAVSAIFGSPLVRNIAVGSRPNGWARISLTDNVPAGFHQLTSADADEYNGLPVTGFSYQIVRNGTLTDASGANVLSNYAGLFNHRYSRNIVGS